MNSIKKNIHTLLIGFFVVMNIFIWSVISASTSDGILKVAFLDVGQGDAIFIETPNGNQILLDGGPNKKVLQQLSTLMPFYDRSIDMVIASHPDKDHIGGLPEVLKRYDIGIALESGASSNSSVFTALESIIKDKKIKHVLARRGQRIFLDKDIFIEVLFPNADVTEWDSNDASIIIRLVYNNISFMLTGDSPKKMERYLLSLDGDKLNSTVLKLGHHGSKTSSSMDFVAYVKPEFAIVSAGKDNRYGHPHKEVVDIIKRFGIPMYSTIESGTIIFKTDGENINIVDRR